MQRQKKNLFKLPYAGIDSYQGISILFGDKGDFSVIIKVENPVLQYAADHGAFTGYQSLLLNIIKILGEGYILQKQDVFARKNYLAKPAKEYLQQKYNEHFAGREYTEITTYLVITRQVKRGAFYTYSKKALVDFSAQTAKVFELLAGSGLKPEYLSEQEINRYTARILSMEFAQDGLALDNIHAGDTEIRIGEKAVRCISLVNTDSVDLPEMVTPYSQKSEHQQLRDYPMDNLAFLHHVPAYRVIVYNQLVEIPSQQSTLHKLELKRKRHSGVPDPANLICVEDIDQLLVDVARENQLLVNAHYSILVCADESRISKAANFIEGALFQQGIIPSRNAYNQLELFRCALPGNAVELKKYDWFLTTSDAALCLLFKESLLTDEASEFLIRFTDRQGIPVGIDPADLPMRSGRINNRNRFVLGPSGSGKSFFMNALVEQYMLYNMDVVIVDTGHSYSGLCSYYNGKYITYSEQRPITMNPFAIDEGEYNIEKKDFLLTLISLLWKGAEGTVSAVERDVISNVISSYYSRYFGDKGMPDVPEKDKVKIRSEVWQVLKVSLDLESEAIEDLEGLLFVDLSSKSTDEESVELPGEIPPLSQRKIPGVIREMFLEQYDFRINSVKERISAEYHYNRVEQLDFNSFYEFALIKIPEIKSQDRIPFDLDEFRYVLKKFYKSGEFESILNEASDQSLFSERFIVFEIDNVKDHKVLFPIVTVIIMDVFIQKMRHRKDQRKALILEEAWKAIASPLMANYLLYVNKTVRKFWGELIPVTQELSDMLGNPVLKDSILSNSDTICLLDQSKFKDNYAEIAKLLSLSVAEQKKIFTINKLDNRDNRGRFKEVYIKRGSSGEVYGVEVSLHQYLAYTTEKPEKSAVEVYAGFYKSYQSGLEAFVSDMQQSGLTLDAFVGKVNMAGKPVESPEFFKPEFV